MIRKVFASLFVILLLVFIAAGSYATIQGLKKERPAIVKVGESITIPEGAEVRSVVSVGGSVTVYGQVSEDVVAVGGSVFLKDSAMVGGDVVAVGGKIMKEPGAISKGDVVEVSVAGVTPAVSFFTKGGMLKGMVFFGLISFFGFLVLAAILVAVFTKQLGRVSGCLEKDLLKNFFVGVLGVILIVPIVVLLAVSIIGIILIPLWIAIVVAAAIFGYVAAGHLIGKKTLHVLRIVGKSMMVETLLGVVLLSLVGLAPYGGPLVKLIAILCGLGGVCLTRFGTVTK
ncbi:MAG: hypothetical protein ABIH50_07355 [bacterium]